jgi:hypothetical protein
MAQESRAMTYFLAAAFLLAIPVFIAFLQGQPQRRIWAFAAIGALPLLTNLTTIGFVYSWPAWNGTVRGFGVSLTVAIALAIIATQKKFDAKLPFVSIFILYGFTLILSVFVSSMWLSAVFVCWQFLSVLVVYAAVSTESHQFKIRNVILTGLSLGLINQAIYVILQKMDGVIQAKGTMGHQNILGLATELAVLPLFGAVLGGDRRPIVFAGIGAALVCIAGSGSRGTIGIAGGAIVLLTLVSLLRNTSSRKFAVVGLGAVVLACATPFAIGTLNERFQGGTFVTEEDERKSFEDMARAMTLKHPLGVGANQFVFVSNRDGYAARAGVPWQQADRSVPVHNAYLLARSETGWLGEFAFILILVVPCAVALRLSFKDRKSPGGEVVLGSAIALVANMVHNNYEFAVHTVDIQALLFINLGIIAAEKRSQITNARNEKRRKAAQRVERRPAEVSDGQLRPTT